MEVTELGSFDVEPEAAAGRAGLRERIIGGAAVLTLAGGVIGAFTVGGSTTGLAASDLSPAAAVARAPAAYARQSTASFTGSEHISVDGQDLSVHLDGAFDLVHKTGTLTTDLAGRESTERIFGTDIFISRNGDSGPWQELDLSSLLSASGKASLQSSSASSTVDVLKNVDGVTDKGPASVDGQAARHYAGTVSVARISSMLSSAAADDSGLSQLSGLSIPVDVYLGRDNLPLRVTEDGDFAVEGLTAHLTATFDYRYGVPVTVQRPPASQVTPGSLSTLGGSSGN